MAPVVSLVLPGSNVAPLAQKAFVITPFTLLIDQVEDYWGGATLG